MKSKIKDPFSYSFGHGAAGLSCSDCDFFEYCKESNSRHCNKHDKCLNMQVDSNGFVRGEWFCNSFQSNEIAKLAQSEFDSIKLELDSKSIYKACARGYLDEYDIN